MLDRERILAKLDELEGYVGELRQIVPASFAEYMGQLEKRRASERLLQLWPAPRCERESAAKRKTPLPRHRHRLIQQAVALEFDVRNVVPVCGI